MSNPVSLNVGNFLGHYVVDPNANELQKKDRVTALIVSIVLGIFTAGIIHAVVAITRASLHGRAQPSPPSSHHVDKQRVEEHFLTMSKLASIEKLMAYIQKNAAEIKKIDIRDKIFLKETQLQEIITQCPDLEELYVKLENLSGQTACYLKSLQKLTTLGLIISPSEERMEDETAVTLNREAAENIAEIPQLRTLELEIEKLDAESLRQFTKAVNLETLKLVNSIPFDRRCINFLPELKIKTLSFHIILWGNKSVPITTILSCLSRMANLKELTIRGITEVNGIFSSKLEEFDKLEVLSLPTVNSINPNAANDFLKMPSLQKLDLSALKKNARQLMIVLDNGVSVQNPVLERLRRRSRSLTSTELAALLSTTRQRKYS